MRSSIAKEFRDQKPRALVLDDNSRAREMTAIRLKSRGFTVIECSSFDEFKKAWHPGMVDVIVADWQLSPDENKHGDRALEFVRRKDWDVPFVLISGRLEEAAERAHVLRRLLDGGSAKFVERGNDGIKNACDSAEDLIERRDLVLLKSILALRPGALTNASLQTSSGSRSLKKMLETLVANPKKSHQTGRPFADAASKKKKAGKNRIT